MEQSATGHSLTLHRPLRLRQLEERVYGVDGTPTDCVNLAILWLLRENPPDLICSGINFGLNLGDDVTYSGTVSATFEGTLLGIPSVAFSQEVGPGFSFQPAATFARDMVSVLIAETLVPDLLLNVNFPLAPFHGVSLTKLGHRVYKQAVVGEGRPTWAQVLLDRRHAGVGAGGGHRPGGRRRRPSLDHAAPSRPHRLSRPGDPWAARAASGTAVSARRRR